MNRLCIIFVALAVSLACTTSALALARAPMSTQHSLQPLPQDTAPNISATIHSAGTAPTAAAESEAASPNSQPADDGSNLPEPDQQSVTPESKKGSFPFLIPVVAVFIACAAGLYVVMTRKATIDF